MLIKVPKLRQITVNKIFECGINTMHSTSLTNSIDINTTITAILIEPRGLG